MRSRRATWWQVFHDSTLEWLRAATAAGEPVFGRGARSLEPGAIAGASGNCRVISRRFRLIPTSCAKRGSGNRPLNGASRPLSDSAVARTRRVSTRFLFHSATRPICSAACGKNVEAANASLQSTAADLGNVQLGTDARNSLRTTSRCANWMPNIRSCRNRSTTSEKLLDLVQAATRRRGCQRPGSCAAGYGARLDDLAGFSRAAIARTI